jgi:hypothetical protein
MHEGAVVRLYGPTGTVVGAGLYVAPGKVLTCAHVVTTALGLPTGTPPDAEAALQADLPLVTPHPVLSLRVAAWQPESDLALLELTSVPPAGAVSRTLLSAGELWGHPFRAFGFPHYHRDGVWVSGRLLAATGQGWVQVEEVKQTGYFVAPGFSGAPVWDEELGGVGGILVATEVDPGVRAAFMIPAARIAQHWPRLVTERSPGQPSQEHAPARGVIRAGTLKATNVVVGVQTPAGLPVDPDAVQAAQGGSIEAEHLEAEHVVNGLQQLPTGGTLRAPGTFSTAAYRQKLERFSDTEIESLCQDHFWEVYNTFGRGQGRVEKINTLLDQCRRKPELGARLVALLGRGAVR